jgi:pimeloyl-ACP methyl ester carboxylesterase
MMDKPILMIHDAGCSGNVWSVMALALKAKGWLPFTPTLFPQFRVSASPTGQLSTLGLHDYVEAAKAEALRIERETGEEPILIGHGLGGLIAQKLAEQGMGKALILITPYPSVDCRVRDPAAAFTHANILLQANHRLPYKIWKTGYFWGILNQVPASKRNGIYDQLLYESGLMYHQLSKPEADPHRVGVIDETAISCPILTIGALQDRAIAIESVRKIAQKYARVGGDYREFGGAAHWIIDEPKTPELLATLHDWLKKHGL